MAKRTPEEDDVLQVENRVNGSHDDEEIDDDGNEDYDSEQRKKSDKKKKKKKRKVRNLMSTSNQTDADRRVLRKRQRELHNDISFDAPTTATATAAGTTNNNDSSEEEEDGDDTTKKSSGLLRWREKNNELWDDVRYTREAVLDSENMDLISSKAAREVEKIIQVRLLFHNGYSFGQGVFNAFHSTSCHCYHLILYIIYSDRSHATMPSP